LKIASLNDKLQIGDKLRFAIIGCGQIAKRHAEHISKRAVLVAVCDVEKEKADELALVYNAKAYYSIESLIAAEDSINAAAICTPNGLHAVHSILCLRAGMHVLCEKPMALNVKDCQLMINASKASGKLVAIVKQNRFNSPVVTVKQLLDGAVLGKIFSIQVNCFWNRDASYYVDSKWKGSKELDGGILFTQFSHFIDILCWFCGDIKTVNAFTSNYNHQQLIDFEDTGVAVIQFESGALGTIHFTINAYQKNIEGSITIFAEKGSVKIGGQYLNTIEFQNIKDVTIDLPNSSNEANDYGTYYGSMSNHDKVYDNFLAALNNKATLSANSIEGMKTVEMIEKIYEAAIPVQPLNKKTVSPLS
jgi:UDP-N-acetyl-2-amino-2-deoxyglucuronate dehydrogenase